jgi:hypothetical protein
MWKHAVDAKDRIKNIEDRIEEVPLRAPITVPPPHQPTGSG